MSTPQSQLRGKPWSLTGTISDLKRNPGRQGRSGYFVGTISTQAGDFKWVLKGAEVPPPKLRAYVTLVGVMEEYAGVKQLQVVSVTSGHTEMPNREPEERCKAPSQRPADLIKYYRACVERERDGNTRVASIDFLPWFKSEGSVLFETLEIKELFPTGVNTNHDDWFSKQLLRNKDVSLRVGYPTVRYSGYPSFLAPIAFIEVGVAVADGGYLLSRTSERLYWNLAGLEAIGVSEDLRDAVLLKLNEITDDLDNDKDRLEKGLEYLLQVTGFDLRRPQGALGAAVELDSIRTVLHREVVYEGSDNTMSEALLKDLGGMIGAANDLETGPLAVFLGTKTNTNRFDHLENLVTVLPSSPDQIKAISRALESEVSCVTGPPGTGKSQFVANLASAAMANGLSVLIASKNNQAVDVAVARLQNATPAGWPVRTGNRTNKEDASKVLTGAISLKRPKDSGYSPEMETWKNVVAEIKSLQATIGQIPELRAVLGKLRGELNELEEGDILTVKEPAELAQLLKFHDLISTHDEIFRSPLPLLFFLKSKVMDRQTDLLNALDSLSPSSKLVEGYAKQAHTLLFEYSAGNKRALSGLCEEVRIVVERSKRFVELKSEIGEKEDLIGDAGTDVEAEERLRSLDDEAAFAGRALVGRMWDAKLNDQAIIKLGLLAKALVAQNSKTLKNKVGPALGVAPIWATTNLSAYPNFPLIQGLFDLVIIDEASQSDLASVLPLLFRAKRAVLVGDPNQLTHITSLSRSEANELAHKYKIEDDSEVGFDYKDVSAFERGLLVSEHPVLLSEHYRSHPAIAEFANRFVYAGRLDICTDPRKYSKGDGLFWHNVEGAAKKRDGRSLFNHEEAVACVNKIVELTSIDQNASIGVVSPFRAQELYIKDLLLKKFGRASLDTMNIRIATAHKFQGDERDFIVLSTVISTGSDEFSLNFANTPNLVNVAITRARRQLHVVGNALVCQNAGGLLGKLADYAESLQRQNFESPAERALFNDLLVAGFNLETQVVVGPYRADLVATLPGSDHQVVIECDGHPFHRDVVRDRVRDDFLKESGFLVLHVPARIALGYGEDTLNLVKSTIASVAKTENHQPENHRH